MSVQDQRPRFFEGQYLAADDIDAVVEYAHVQSARHELGAHTWGIALGLTLSERPATGAPKRVDVFMTPGVAEDGFGRKLVALAPVRVPESLFANIPYDADVDDPAKNNGTPVGRFVRVWIAYDEQNGVAPAPGFERCDAGDEYARIKESYRFVIGDQPLLVNRRTPIVVAAQSMDAADALKRFDAAAPTLTDASVPQQQFPENNRQARWLVPIGWVRWVVTVTGGGYFVDRNSVATDTGDDRIRKARQYLGVVAENIHASDGALVLRNRLSDPNGNGYFQSRLQSSDTRQETLRDLVWVEGNLRVVGDARLAAGALRFADINGKDEDTPLSIERLGDKPAVIGKRSLDALIGPDTQKDNRFAVATVVADNPDPSKRTLSEKLTVLSGGNVGVSNDAPAYKLHVKGDRVRLNDAGSTKTLDLRVDDAQVSVESRTNDLYVRSTGGTPVHNVIINPDTTDGNVGIGTSAPVQKLHVKGARIRLDSVDNARTIDIRTDGTQVDVESRTSDLYLRATGGAPAHNIVMNPDDVDGNVGIGTGAPAFKLDVRSKGIKLGLEANGGGRLILANNPGDNKIFMEGFSSDGNNSASELLLTGKWGAPLPQCSITAITTYCSGNLGVGTAAPGDRLHVAGQFIRIDGTNGEIAAVGSEGNASVVLGTRKPGVGIADMRNLTVAFNQTDPAAWLEVWCRGTHEVSDERAKTNIQPIKGALDQVTQLRGVSYHWKTTEEAVAARSRLGLIAQEVKDIVPQAVTINERGAGISYSTFVPLLIEAVKELKAEHESVKSQLEEIKRQLAALSSRAAAKKGKSPRRLRKRS